MATFVWAPEDEAKKAKLDRVKQQNAANIQQQSKPVASTWPAPVAAPVTPKIAEQWGSSDWIGMQKQPTPVKPVTPVTPTTPTTTPPQQDKIQSELEQAYADKTKAAEELALAKQRQGLEQDVREVEQNKEAVAFTKKKQEAETKIRDLNIQSQNTKAQQNMDAAFQQMQNLKQNLAYIGSRWVPWKSAAQFDAMQRSLDDAQRTYSTLSQLEGQRKEMQDIGVEFDSVAYARQIKQLQDDLDSKVNTTVQDAINSFMQESWDVDTIDELKQLQDKYLDMVDTNLETMTSREVVKWEALNEQYATRLEDARKKVENVGKIDTERSQMYGYYVDMNGNTMLDASWKPIVHSGKDVIDPYVDETTGQLVRVTMWPDGKPVTTLTKVIDVPQVTQGALGDIKAAVAAGKLSVEDAVKLFPSLSRQPELLAQLAATAPTPQAEAPAPKTVTVDTPGGKATYQYNEQTGRFDIPVWTNYETEAGVPIQDAIATAVSQCANGAQCWEFINKVGKAAWVDLWIKDSYESKVQAIQKIGEAQSLDDIDAGSIFAYPVDGSEYGHIGIVTSKNEDGRINIMDYNYNLDEKQRERTNVDYAEILNKGGSISKPLITDTTVETKTTLPGFDDIIAYNDPVSRRQMSQKDVKRIAEAKSAIMKDPNAELSDVLMFSTWGKQVGAEQSKQFAKYDQAMQTLSTIQEQISDMETWPILWRLRELNPYDTDAQILKTQLQWLIPTLARGVYGEVWVLTDNDIKLYAKTIPNLKWTKAVNEWVLAFTLDVLAGWYLKQLKSMAWQWYDVSGLEWVYENIKWQADSLKQQLGISGWWEYEEWEYVWPDGKTYIFKEGKRYEK